MIRIQSQNYFDFKKMNLHPKEVVDAVIKDVLHTAKIELSTPINKIKVLDVGCGTGSYTFGIEMFVNKVVGLEPFNPAYEEALKNKRKLESKASFVNQLIEEYITKEKFDIIISLTTIEHMKYPIKSFDNIFKLLKD